MANLLETLFLFAHERGPREEKKRKQPEEQKDTIKPSAPLGNDGARASSLCLIRPRWEPAGADRDDGCLRQRDIVHALRGRASQRRGQAEVCVIASVLTSSFPRAMSSFSSAAVSLPVSDALTARAKVSTRKAHMLLHSSPEALLRKSLLTLSGPCLIHMERFSGWTRPPHLPAGDQWSPALHFLPVSGWISITRP